MDGSNGPQIQLHPGSERGDAAEQRDSKPNQITPQFRIIQKSIAALQMKAAGINAAFFQSVCDMEKPVDLSLRMCDGFRVQIIRFIEMRIKAGNPKMGQRIVTHNSVQVLRGFAQTVHSGVDRQMRVNRKTGLIQLTGLIVTGQG